MVCSMPMVRRLSSRRWFNFSYVMSVVRMAYSNPVDTAATRVIATSSSISVTPRSGRMDNVSRAENAAAESLERKRPARLAIHPPDFELDAVDDPAARACSGSGFHRLNDSPPAGAHRTAEGRIPQALCGCAARDFLVDQQLVHLLAR